MRKFFLSKAIFFALFLCFFSANGSYALGNTEPSKISMEDIFLKNVDGKLYVKDGIVHVSPEGIFLCVKGSMIPISQIEADEEGVFVRCGGDKNWPRCPGCGLPLVAGVCMNLSCPLSPLYDPNYSHSLSHLEEAFYR